MGTVVPLKAPIPEKPTVAGRLSIDGTQKLIERLGRKAGINHLHIHMLRHSTGYALSNRGVSTRDLQAFMGHRNISNTVIYTAVADKRLRTIWRKR